jgi:hypothetical protein
LHPYKSLAARSFWRTAVAELEPADITDLWSPKFSFAQDAPILTAGSCFAHHLGPALLQEGMFWLDAEPAPPGLTSAERQACHYGEFSFRTGNIYTGASLRQWLAWAFEEAEAPSRTWCEDGRYYDPFRPAVEPQGYESAEAVLAARENTLAAVRDAVATASCLIFTLGLTESWRDSTDGATYPVCPGTVRGAFDADRHIFHNATVSEVHRDMSEALAIARRANPELRVLLTVSPVPLTATATGQHALTATTYSKSVLRAVAGQLAEELDHVDYFPSYEIVTGFPFRARFFEPNLRTVSREGVAFVMDHFFRAIGRRTVAPTGSAPNSNSRTVDGEDSSCEDALLDYYNRIPVPPAR